MKTKTYLITISIAIFGLGLSLQAQESNQSQSAVLAEELLSLLNVQKTMDTALQQISKMQDQSPSLAGATPQAKEMQQKIREAINAETKAMMNWETIKPTFISIYSETFTPDELQGMITFYKSPIGQKWLEKQPQLQMATMQKMQTIMAEMQPKMQETIKRVIESQKEAK